MRLHKLIGEIGAKYDRQLPMSSEAHELLHRAEVVFQQWVPSGHVVEGNGGKSQPAITPRIVIFNPDETTTTRRGMFVAYLFAADKSTVTLTLSQGASEMAGHLGRAGARLVLLLEARTIRAALRKKDIADLDVTFDLRTTAASSVDFQHANIVSRTYRLDRLPRESMMMADLQRFMRIYALAIEAREVARKHGRHEFMTLARHAMSKVATEKPTEPELELKAEPKAELKAEPKAELKAEPKPEPKAELKPEPKAELKPEPKPERGMAPAAGLKVRAKTEPKAEPKIGPKAEPVVAEQVEPAAKKSEHDLIGRRVKRDAKKRVLPPESPKKAPETAEPLITEDRKRKILARPVTRRSLLAALVAAPVAYVTPVAAGGTSQQHRSSVKQVPPPPKTTPLFTIDVSQHDWKRRGGNLDWTGIRHAGIVGMCARATYGDPAGYHWPTHHFGDFARAAKKAGMGLRGGYHNIVRGDQESINRQVDWLRRELDKYDLNWAMLDVERYSELVKADMWPRWDDVRRFDDRWAQLESRVLVGYIPPWNWSKHLGQPDLREYRGPLIASNYPSNANEGFKQLYDRIGGNDGRGWASYGNRVPEGWQYSSRAQVPGAGYICDVNAWRMNYEELKTQLLDRRHGGRGPAPQRPAPPPEL